MRSRWLVTIWPTIHFYSKLTISLLTILSKTGPELYRQSYPLPPPLGMARLTGDRQEQLISETTLIVQCNIIETQKFLKNNNIYLRLRGENWTLEVEENWKIRNSCKIRKSGISEYILERSFLLWGPSVTCLRE